MNTFGYVGGAHGAGASHDLAGGRLSLSGTSAGGLGERLFYMALFPSVICYLIYYYALSHIPASRVSAFAYLQPVLATIMAVVALGEHVTQAAGRRRRGDLLRRLPDGARLMAAFFELLRNNRNYRYTWMGQVVSEVGDHFNNIAVFSLALANTRSGLVVSGVMLSRAIPAVLAGPLAGVLLDRLDRKRVMIASDLIRAVVALGFILTVNRQTTWLLYVLSGLLMFASPFFTSGRAAILPTIASHEELHTANSLTQTTQWTTLTIGAFLGGASVDASWVTSGPSL